MTHTETVLVGMLIAVLVLNAIVLVYIWHRIKALELALAKTAEFALSQFQVYVQLSKMMQTDSEFREAGWNVLLDTVKRVRALEH